MEITTTFAPGDLAWCFNDGCQLLTVGKVEVSITDTPGTDDDAAEMFDNYRPKKSRRETYMCVETGIDCGRVYTLGNDIHATREACEQANAERLAELEAQKQEMHETRKRKLLADEASLRARLAEIERIKSATVPA